MLLRVQIAAQALLVQHGWQPISSHLFFKTNFSIILPFTPRFPNGLFLLHFPAKRCTNSRSPLYVPHSHPPDIDLINQTRTWLNVWIRATVKEVKTEKVLDDKRTSCLWCEVAYCCCVRVTFCSPVVAICTASLTFNNITFCPHSAFMCFVWIWEQTAIISLYSINWLVFITETECVYCAVRAKSLAVISVNLGI